MPDLRHRLVPSVGTNREDPARLLSIVYAAGVYSTLTRSAWMGAGLAVLVVVLFTSCAVANTAAYRARCELRVVRGDELAEPLAFNAIRTSAPASAKNRPSCVRSWPRSPGNVSRRSTVRLRLRAVSGTRAQTILPIDRENCRWKRPAATCSTTCFSPCWSKRGSLGLSAFLLLLVLDASAWRLWNNPHAPDWARECGLLMLAFVGNYVVNGVFHDVLDHPDGQYAAVLSRRDWSRASSTSGGAPPRRVAPIVRKPQLERASRCPRNAVSREN